MAACLFPENAEPESPALQYAMNDVPAYRAFARSLRGIRMLRKLRRCDSEHSLQAADYRQRQEHWKRCFCHLIIRRYFKLARRIRGCTRNVEKTPAHLYYVPEIKTTFPDARFLVVTRHPIDIFTSYRCRLQQEQGSSATGTHDWLRSDSNSTVQMRGLAKSYSLACGKPDRAAIEGQRK